MGFDVNRFEAAIDEELLCPICASVLENPRHAPECEHAFCYDCIRQWIETQPTCPVDRQPVSMLDLKPIPRILRNMIGRLEISCDNVAFGCDRRVKLDMLATHRESCEFNPKRLVTCPAGCASRVPANELNGHNCIEEMRRLIGDQAATINELRSDMHLVSQQLSDHRAEIRLLREWVMASRSDEDLCHSRMDSSAASSVTTDSVANAVIHQAQLPIVPQPQLDTPPFTRLSDRQRTNMNDDEHARLTLSYVQQLTRPSANGDRFQRRQRVVPAARDESVVRWAASLPRARVTRWGGMISTPDLDLQARIERSLAETGCPPAVLTELMANAHERSWPAGLVSLETRQVNRQQYENYVCRRINARHQAVAVMACDNAHMSDDMILEPGIVIIFAHGIESQSY